MFLNLQIVTAQVWSFVTCSMTAYVTDVKVIDLRKATFYVTQIM